MKVTVGIPFFNNQTTLQAAIQSVFAQSFQDWELLLVDDGSTDASLAIARRISDPRVRVMSDGINRGLSARLNEIAAHARGRYVARLDGDDLLHPDRLARQVAFLDAHSGVDLVGTATYCIDSAEALVGIRRAKEATAGAGHVLRHVVVVHATAMGRTEWFRRNPYDGAYVNAEDHELWCRTCSTSSFAQIDEPLYFYRELDSFRFEKYRTTCRTLRRMLWRYGPPAAGYGATASLIAGTLVRQSIYGLFSAAGAARMLINRRNRRVTAQERADAMRALRRIGDTPVPGLTTVRAAG